MYSLTTRLKIALEVLESATPILLEGYSATPGADLGRTQKLGLETKSSFKDLVTVYDKKVEAFIVDQISKRFPHEVIIGEETTASGTKSPWDQAKNLESFWLLDPIDGTTNYSRSYPFFCSTLSWVTRENNSFIPQIGVTWNPVTREMFYAATGQGAFLNRQGLKVSRVSNLQEALLTTGFASERSGHSETSFQLFKDFTRKTLGVRRDGAAALDLAYVAAGRIDVYFEWGLSAWDIAAGAVLVREAGGIVTNLDGQPLDIFSGRILSSNQELYPPFLEEISKVYK